MEGRYLVECNVIQAGPARRVEDLREGDGRRECRREGLDCVNSDFAFKGLVPHLSRRDLRIFFLGYEDMEGGSGDEGTAEIPQYNAE